MKKLGQLNHFTAWLILTFALVFASGPAQAYIYDDFTTSGINSSLWEDRGPDYGLFSQPGDGYLYFNDSIGGKDDYLRTPTRWDMPFFVSMQFSDYQTINNDLGNFRGSGPVLWIGDSTNRIKVYEFKNDGVQGFWALQAISGTPTHLGTPVATSTDSGWLGIGYDGTTVSLWYDDDSGTGWHLLTTQVSGFTQPPLFGIEGYNLYGESLSFKIDQVQFDPVPIPAGVLLLGTGLLGLAGWRRFIKS